MNQEINIFIKSLSNEQTKLKVYHSEKIETVKQRYGEIKKIDKASIKLVFKGKTLEDQNFLNNYGIGNGDLILSLVQKNQSGSQKETKNVSSASYQDLVKLGYDEEQSKLAMKKHNNNIKEAICEIINQKQVEEVKINQIETIQLLMKVDMVQDLKNELHGNELLKIQTLSQIEQCNKSLFQDINQYLKYEEENLKKQSEVRINQEDIQMLKDLKEIYSEKDEKDILKMYIENDKDFQQTISHLMN